MAKVVFRVGCCGFPKSRKAYYERFDVVELQQTFYRLPKLETVERWRKEAPRGFTFTIKAWQVITHPPSSPTWRKAGIEASLKGRLDCYGDLKPTNENLEAWNRVLEVARVLGPTIVVFQTPPSFGYSEENYEHVIEFFGRIKRDGFRIAWEPRGTWLDNLDAVRSICERRDVIHAVDVFKTEPAHVGDVVYIRLHGIGRGYVNYSYKYTQDDLLQLLRYLDRLLETHGGVREVYVLFNNKFMWEDASRFKAILEDHVRH